MKIKIYIILLIMGMTAFSCVKDDALLMKDSFMDYEIPIIPVETDYVVGAFYSPVALLSTVSETPTVAIKEAGKGDPEAYAQHVTQAQSGGIDYFLFRVRSTNDIAAYQSDSTFIDTLQMASNAAEMNFALSYDFGSMGLGNDNTIEDAGLVATFLYDFEKLVPLFQMSNYMKVDGRCVVYMRDSRNLFSNDNVALYQQLRTQMSGLGVELFLIGHQNEWTPPLRYDMRFVDCVDASTHSTYANLSNNWYDRIFFFHKMCDQAWSYHQETLGGLGVEYIPTIVPSFIPTIGNPSSNNHVFAKDPEWFSAHCNVARKVAGDHKLILIESFNDWNRGTQLESAESYGNEYLNILRQEFKTN